MSDSGYCPATTIVAANFLALIKPASIGKVIPKRKASLGIDSVIYDGSGAPEYTLPSPCFRFKK